MQNNSHNFFDIFDLLKTFKKNFKKLFFFSILYFFASLILPILFLSNNKSEIHFIFEDEKFMTAKNTAFTNFIVLGKSNINNLHSSKIWEPNYNQIFFMRHVYGLEQTLPSSLNYMSSEYGDFFNNVAIKYITDDKVVVSYDDPNNSRMQYNENFILNLVKELNFRMHKSIYELLVNKNKDIKKIGQIHFDIFKDIDDQSYTDNSKILNNIYIQNNSTINEYLDADIDNFLIFKEIITIKKKSQSFKFYLLALFIYIYFIIFITILLYGFDLKITSRKQDVK